MKWRVNNIGNMKLTLNAYCVCGRRVTVKMFGVVCGTSLSDVNLLNLNGVSVNPLRVSLL